MTEQQVRQYKAKWDSKLYSLKTPEIEQPSQYPSEWFVSNKKPKALYGTSNGDINTVRKIMRGGIHSTVISVEYVKKFIHLYFSGKAQPLSEKWESYGVVIGEPKSNVTPWDIIDVSVSTATVTVGNEMAANEADDHWMIYYALAGCRLGRTTNEDYYKELAKRVLLQAKVKGCPINSAPPKSMFDVWILDDDYAKIVAAVDMFLSKFTNILYSPLKICTISSRHRDCTALLSVGFIAGVAGLEQDSDILDWLFTQKLGMEALNLAKADEEIAQADSYFPYQSDMKLVQKTYYSAAKNKQLSFFLHAVGTLLGSTRSKNAQLLTEENLKNNYKNAIIMAYACSTYTILDNAFTEASQSPFVPENLETEEIEEPTNNSGAAWYSHMHGMDFRLTPEMEQFVEKARTSLGDVREGTIGEYVKRTSSY